MRKPGPPRGRTGIALLLILSVFPVGANQLVPAAPLWLAIGVLACIALVHTRGQLMFAAPVVIYLVIASVWTIFGAPSNGVGDGVRLLARIGIGVIIGSTLPLAWSARVIYRTCLSLAVASLGFALMFPSQGRHGAEHSYAIRGVFEHKNNLGVVVAIGIAAALLVPANTLRERRLRFAGIAVLTMTLLSINSATSVIVVSVTAALLGTAAVLRRLSSELKFVAILVVAVGATTTWLTGAWQGGIAGLLGMVGRDATLTGRATIWPRALTAAADAPVFGRGIGWTRSAEAEWILRTGSGFGAASHENTHSGFLTVLLEFGAIGLAALLVMIAYCIWVSIRLFRLTRNRTDLWVAWAAVAFILYNLAEEFSSGVLMFLLAMSITASTVRLTNLRESRARIRQIPCGTPASAYSGMPNRK